MSTVLVGVDGSETAARALRWTLSLATRGATQRLVVATVYVADPTSARSWDSAHDHDRGQLDEWCEPVRAVGVPYDAVLLDGEAGAALLAAGERCDAELIVVSRRGCGGFDALVAGSTADYLAHHARRPLAIVPPAGATPAPRLLVALDGSKGSVEAATWAAGLATRLHARVVAAHVVVPHEVVGHVTDAQRARAEEALNGPWSAPLRDAGLGVDYRLLSGRHPADALIELAHYSGAELIVAGTRELGGLRLIRLGGVTMQLLHHSGVPVVVVPPPS